MPDRAAEAELAACEHHVASLEGRIADLEDAARDLVQAFDSGGPLAHYVAVLEHTLHR